MEQGRAWRAMHAIAGHLGRGLALLPPLAATVWLLWWLFVAIDELFPTERLFGREIRGVGILAVLVIALLVGLLTTDPWVRRALRSGESVLLRLPVFNLVYSTFREFASALLVKKRFDKPVLVKLGKGFDAQVIGFVTREHLDSLGVLDRVAVYFPQSYNIGGNVMILPRERLTPIHADSALVMSFIVTGGVACADGHANGSPALAAPTPGEPGLEEESAPRASAPRAVRREPD